MDNPQDQPTKPEDEKATPKASRKPKDAPKATAEGKPSPEQSEEQDDELEAPIPYGGSVHATTPIQMMTAHLKTHPVKAYQTPREIRDELRLSDTRALDHQIVLHYQKGINIVQQVEIRVQELLLAKQNGKRLNRAQRNLIDFWFCDHTFRKPEKYQYADMLRRAESVNDAMQWQR